MPQVQEINDTRDRDRRMKWLKLVEELSPQTDPTAIRLMDELRQVANLMRRVTEQGVASSGLSLAKYRLLMDLLYQERIEDRCEMNPSEISERQGTTRNTVSALIRDLEDDGLVTRRLDQSDRRRFNITLTTAGRERVLAHASDHLQVVTHCFDVLSQDEKDTLGQLLAKLSNGSGQSDDSRFERNERIRLDSIEK